MYQPLDSFRNQFAGLPLAGLAITICGPLNHCAHRSHATIALKTPAAAQHQFARAFIQAGEQ